MEYISGLLLFYGLAFLLTFYGLMIYNRLTRKSETVNKIIGSLIISLVLILVLAAVHVSGLILVPNGRILLVGLISFLLGPLAGVIAALISSLFLYLLDGTNPILLMAVQMVNILIFYIARTLQKRRNRNPKGYEIFLYGGILNTAVAVFSLLMETKNAVYPINLSYYLMTVAEAMLMCGLLNIVYREQERGQLIENLRSYSFELEQKNKKIESLYDEVSSNEEEQRKNLEELTRYEERIEYMAFHEGQTGFLNHEKLMEQLREHKQAKQEPYGAMLMIGIIDVEKLERTLGIVLLDTLHYLAGIEIIAVFEHLAGGQVFSINKGKYAILISKEHKKETIEEAYRNLKQRFLESFTLNTIELKVNVAAGALEFTDEVLKPEQYIEQCEFALFNAAADDSTNANIVWFGRELMAMHTKELQIEKELYKALEKNELFLMYQPQYNNERKMIGAEALLRWKHPELGEIPPGIFIPVAVRIGLIDSIGKLVLQYACNFIDRNLELLGNQGEIIPISVNASFIELINPNFTRRFLDVLTRNRIPSDYIRVEVTESEISIHYSELEENLKQLHKAGIGVELDDFGTGYSSLNRLGSMPVHTIKIDKVFVDKILIDNKIGDLIEMIIDFAHRFHMRIIAEGVETEEQFLWLKNHNCDAYQGYYFSKPLKEDILLDKLKQFRQLQ